MKKGFKTKLAILMLAVSLPATSLFATSNVDAASASVTAKQNKVVQTALSLQSKVQYVNWKQRQEVKPPYKTDCSGFTYLTYRLANIGVSLVNKDDDDQAKVGTKVSWSNLQKGDLVFFWLNSKNKSDVGHVGIYIGDGKMIHNLTAARDVVITNIYTNNWYKQRFVVARRVIK
ncbi:C40 family peptidase [Paenibacillus sp. YIM B09110]|uniref:C40 family peptidase n=1 Tax=Paenibacillus sp. YIM B09110 TaxID=3126102 RepID=UPI00301DEE5B